MKTYKNEDGDLHQVNAPAFKWGDNYSWYYNGEIHRYYGPARCLFGGLQYWIFYEKVK